MDLPELNKWFEVLCQLPNHKASGSSHISNKMLKHLGSSTNHKL